LAPQKLSDLMSITLCLYSKSVSLTILGMALTN